MSQLFQNRYRIESTRLSKWNYGSVGIYFITICTQSSICWFGKIKKGEMYLSNAGKIVASEWIRTEAMRVRVKLDKWIIMPNHFHGIIILKDKNGIDHVETHCNASLQPCHPGHNSRFRDGWILMDRDALQCVSTAITIGTRGYFFIHEEGY